MNTKSYKVEFEVIKKGSMEEVKFNCPDCQSSMLRYIVSGVMEQETTCGICGCIFKVKFTKIEESAK